MFEYAICNGADREIFKKQCQAIEKNVAPLTKGKLLTDVDESTIQFYFCNGKEIKVFNSYYTNEVYIESELQSAHRPPPLFVHHQRKAETSSQMTR